MIDSDTKVTAFGNITLQSNDQFEIDANGAGFGFTNGIYGVNSDFSVSSVDISVGRFVE